MITIMIMELGQESKKLNPSSPHWLLDPSSPHWLLDPSSPGWLIYLLTARG
jgi:hypothetical protein